MATIGLKGHKGKRAKGAALKKNKAAIERRIEAGTDIAVARAAAQSATKKAVAARKKLTSLEAKASRKRK